MNSHEKIKVTESLTEKTADLARLELSETEVSSFTQQLDKVLDHIEQIQAVDVSDVEPLMNPLDQQLKLREDEPHNESEHLLESAPEVLYDGYKVPPVL